LILILVRKFFICLNKRIWWSDWGIQWVNKTRFLLLSYRYRHSFFTVIISHWIMYSINIWASCTAVLRIIVELIQSLRLIISIVKRFQILTSIISGVLIMFFRGLMHAYLWGIGGSVKRTRFELSSFGLVQSWNKIHAWHIIKLVFILVCRGFLLLFRWAQFPNSPWTSQILRVILISTLISVYKFTVSLRLPRHHIL
jgi:hypothetical protein